MTVDKPKAKQVLHHDDPPCDSRLEDDGYCPACDFMPDTQSICLRPYCPKCDCLLQGMRCPLCRQRYEKPDR